MRVCERVCVCAAEIKQKMKERGRVTGEERSRRKDEWWG